MAPLGNTEAPKSWMYVAMNQHGVVGYIDEEAPNKEPMEFFCHNKHSENYGCLCMNIHAESLEAAIKSVDEKRRQHIAEGTWDHPHPENIEESH